MSAIKKWSGPGAFEAGQAAMRHLAHAFLYKYLRGMVCLIGWTVPFSGVPRIRSKPCRTEQMAFHSLLSQLIVRLSIRKAGWPQLNLRASILPFRVGLGFIGDFTAYSQSATFKQQMDSLNIDLDPRYQTRDFRVLGSGRFLLTKRHIAWKFAFMYDGDEKVWMVRESGLTVEVPELKGHFFLGRTKEGWSMIKVHERSLRTYQ